LSIYGLWPFKQKLAYLRLGLPFTDCRSKRSASYTDLQSPNPAAPYLSPHSESHRIKYESQKSSWPRLRGPDPRSQRRAFFPILTVQVLTVQISGRHPSIRNPLFRIPLFRKPTLTFPPSVPSLTPPSPIPPSSILPPFSTGFRGTTLRNSSPYSDSFPAAYELRKQGQRKGVPIVDSAISISQSENKYSFKRF
jgi:hypothetical protein